MSGEQVEAARTELPELPEARRLRYVSALGLTPYAAGVLTGHPRIAAFYEAVLTAGGEALKAANFVQSEVLRDTRTSGLEASFPLTAAQVAEILRLVDEGTISGKQAKELYAAVKGTDRLPSELVKELGMAVLSDAGALEKLARALLAANPKQVKHVPIGTGCTIILGLS